MSDANDDAWRQLAYHLESLRRAGLMDLPVGQWSPPEHLAEELTSEVARSPAVEPVEIELSNPVESFRPDPPISPRSEMRRTPAGGGATGAPARPVRPTISVAAMFDESRRPIESPLIPKEEHAERLKVLADEVAACTQCPHLAATRTQTVFQSGSPTARLMFIGEAPGADEDRQGEPFVGRAGQLLTDIISKGMGLSRSDVYIANILKCRPPENRNPLPDEIANCRGFLDRQIEIVRPEFLCLLGKVAVSAILETSLPMKSMRQRWFRYRDIPTVVTWHPAYLLRNPAAKKETWEDVKLLMNEMGLKPPGKV